MRAQGYERAVAHTLGVLAWDEMGSPSVVVANWKALVQIRMVQGSTPAQTRTTRSAHCTEAFDEGDVGMALKIVAVHHIDAAAPAGTGPGKIRNYGGTNARQL